MLIHLQVCGNGAKYGYGFQLNSIREELIQEAVEIFVQFIKKIELPTEELLRFVKEREV
ncbi:hypothetical protein AB4Z22_13795 [Paenibacillus sp. TAF58]